MEPINRKLLKQNAKIALKKNFWIIMLVCFCANFLGGNFSGLTVGSESGGSAYSYGSSAMGSGMAGFEEAFNNSPVSNGNEFHYKYNKNLSNAENWERFFDAFLDSIDVQVICIIIAVVCIVFLLVYLVSIVISFLIGAFLCGPVSVGYKRFFMLNRMDKSQFTDLFSSFGKGRYMNVVKTMFKTNLEIYLWRLLFYFPGLVKYYQYFFVGYIVAENPQIDNKRAKELSKQMSDGHKWQIFVLGLSFIGWSLLFILIEVLLAVISCGILAIPGALLIYPLVGYQQATFAELYEERREYALMTGMATHEELVGFDMDQMNPPETGYEL